MKRGGQTAAKYRNTKNLQSEKRAQEKRAITLRRFYFIMEANDSCLETHTPAVVDDNRKWKIYSDNVLTYTYSRTYLYKS